MGVGRALARTLFYALALVWAAVDEQVDEQLTADDLVQAEDDIADDVALHACTSCRRPQQINTRAVIFNRVPKCGSTTLERIIKKQARHRGFVFSRSKDYVNNSIDEVEQRRFAEHVTAMAKRGRVVYDRHVLYVNFARFGVPTPAYINLLRDPLRMQVSAYYFWRDCICTSRKSFCRHAWQASPSAPVCNVTIDDVYAEVKETTPVVGVITRFFCGQESACLAADPQPAARRHEALVKALGNLESRYVWVGVLERFEDSLVLLSRLLPAYFGALRAKLDSQEHVRPTNSAPYPAPSSSTLDKISAENRNDLELYRHALSRLDCQLQWCRGGGSAPASLSTSPTRRISTRLASWENAAAERLLSR